MVMKLSVNHHRLYSESMVMLFFCMVGSDSKNAVAKAWTFPLPLSKLVVVNPHFPSAVFRCAGESVEYRDK
jgi:hypothetical protein